ncbi:hypothetical protein LTR08_003874 [Meristemomyces frigidus]|nr:hypothetical protein LTR08_003874 [Meristemomyces frigidus]
MATSTAVAGAIKAALLDGSASPSTTTTLESLLSAESPIPIPESRAPVKASAKRTRSLKPASRITAKKSGVAIHEDAPTGLSPKAKYALATEVVNLTLKVLSEAAKPQVKPSTPPLTIRKESSTPATPRSTRVPPEPLQPLQARSGNEASLLASPAKASATRKNAPKPTAAITATAECARLAFAHLRSVNTQNLGVKDTPKMQLETGMLALAARLIALGMATLAIKELRTVKRRLQGVTRKAVTASVGEESEKQTLASLMQLDAATESPDILPLAVTYQQLVMKVIIASGKPAVIEGAVQYLSLDSASAPANLLLRHGQFSGDSAKTTRLLEALAHTLLSLCPSVSAAHDSVAINGSINPCPTTIFTLQVLALQIRQKWWKLAGHRVDHQRELAEPFLKCVTTFARRSAICGLEAEAYDSAQTAFTALGLPSPICSPDIGFQLFRALAHLAGIANRSDDALRYAEMMVHVCEGLEDQHARSLASLVNLATLLIKPGSSASVRDLDGRLVVIADRLRGQLSGHTADYDLLLAELAQLVHCISSANLTMELSSANAVVHLAASFAQRYARSYPNKNVGQAQAILYSALRCSKASEDLHKWVTTDAATVFIQSGGLWVVAQAAASKPLAAAWATSPTSIALDRVLRALLLKGAKSSNGHAMCAAYDDEALSSVERAALLEWQLMYAMELADTTKYRVTLRRPIQDFLLKLSKLYTVADYPVRRARVVTAALRLSEGYPDLLPPHALEAWQDDSPMDGEHLAEDAELGAFADDVKAGLEVARAFHAGGPTAASLKPALMAWQKLLDGSSSAEMLQRHVDRSEVLILQLRFIASYFGMLGDDAARLPLLRLSYQLSRVSDSSGDEQTVACIDVAQQYMGLGFSEKAGHVLAEGRKTVSRPDVLQVTKLRFNLTYAEYALTIDNVESTRQTLKEAEVLRAELPPERVTRSDRTAYELAHAHGWLIHSKLSLESGDSHNALAGAKNSVRVLNTAWLGIEKSSGSEPISAVADSDVAEPKESDAVNGLAAGVSKLQLTPSDIVQSKEDRGSGKGAAFWEILPIMCRNLLHLSDMYVHHGLFAEADYYSLRAVSVAESTNSNYLSSRIRSHRSRFLALSGRLEDAELCLTRLEEGADAGTGMAQVERCCAKAAIRAKEGSSEEALELYQRALEVIESMQTPGFVRNLERLLSNSEEIAAQEACLTLDTRKDNCGGRAPRKPAVTRTTSIKGVRAGSALSKALTARPAQGRKFHKLEETSAEIPAAGYYLISKLKTSVLLESAVVSLRLGNDIETSVAQLDQSHSSMRNALCQRRLQSQQSMCKAVATLQSDISYNMLSESTLSFPALARTGTRPSAECALVPSPQQAITTRLAPAKTGARKRSAAEDAVALLQVARNYLIGGHSASSRFRSTADVFLYSSLLSNISMLLSATGCAQAKSVLHPVREAHHIEYPKVHSLHRETQAVLIDNRRSSSPFAWPESAEPVAPSSVPAAAFQEQYVDILPKPWTVVSLSLDEDCSELYVVRYRSGQAPFILRLPFSRHKQDEDDQEVFDYNTGKAELQDIIQVSNYSCHNTGSTEAKGAKKSWWNEREALDKRLHEFLINVENIWFGGFKGIFSHSQRHPDLLARFRRSLDDIFARYLPSRQAVKGRKKPLSLDDKVLELFTGLGSDQDGVIDLDEPLADLLYFVVDMLQFNGERNAYDEIDFDGMAVDVLDALRSYHEACPAHDNQHLVLVLDKRLQEFPWESLPCLQGVSVSRVGSLLSLRQRVLAMKQAAGDRAGTRDCHTVSRMSGLYILNPSKDLASTQSTMSASLSRLTEGDGARWTAMVQQAPSEDEFRIALGQTSMVLYFGHGSGAQYIRPRTIRKLDKCSEVVWLMGCSSGAVTEHGELEPSAVPLAYLMAGKKEGSEVDSTSFGDSDAGLTDGSTDSQATRCMAVVATLWDVTDKDIDRFSLAVGEEWGLWPPSDASRVPAKTPSKPDRFVAPSTPQQVPKTPKTPKTRKAPAKTPARSGSRPKPVDARKKSLVEAVSRSRDACYLKYLNGAAPVVYGVPVYLGD